MLLVLVVVVVDWVLFLNWVEVVLVVLPLLLRVFLLLMMKEVELYSLAFLVE